MSGGGGFRADGVGIVGSERRGGEVGGDFTVQDDISGALILGSAGLGGEEARAVGVKLVAIEDGVFRGELILRLAWYLAATRQGAVLIHACALKEGDQAIVASGKSGDGKSTLSRLGVGAGMQLLTDEVVMLFPDGRVCGTPFRSDFENAGQPGLVKAKYFFALEKAQNEELKELSALAATQLAMAQCFDVAEVALPRAEVRKRLLAFLGNVEVRTLAFRKAPEAGTFLRGLI